VHKNSRSEAISAMKKALDEFVIEPIKTSIPACRQIISHNLFAKGKVDTDFVERHL